MNVIKWIAILFIISLTGCSTVKTNEDKIETALANNKAVLIVKHVRFDRSLYEGGEIAKDYLNNRNAITYWQNNSAQTTLTIADKHETGQLTLQKDYYIIEPGDYDLIGTVWKDRAIQEIRKGTGGIPVSDKPMRSSLGNVEFSNTEIRDIRDGGQEWVRPELTGVSYDPATRTQTNYFKPGYYVDTVKISSLDALLIDTRGIPAYDSNKKPTLGGFSIKAGEILELRDFNLDFGLDFNRQDGICNMPKEALWSCAVDSIVLSQTEYSAVESTQRNMLNNGYSPELVMKIRPVSFELGSFFSGKQEEFTSSMGDAGFNVYYYKHTINRDDKK